MRTYISTLNKYLGLSVSVFLLAASSNAAWAAPNVEFAIRWSTADDRYHVYMKPSITPSPDAHLNGQVTIVVPHSSELGTAFKINDLISTVANTTWSASSRVNAPIETNGAYDYLSFTLRADQANAFGWQANKEIEVFNFANAGKCLGPVSLMENNDPFNIDSNSARTNPGNELSNLGWDMGGNAYLANYAGAANCSDSLDTDGDGLNNGLERQLGTNPNNPDTDGDGLTDSVEVNTTKTDPLKADTDGDGLTDSIEVNTIKTDPLKADTDGDGLTDSVEVNTTKTDPLKVDTDGDGLSDQLELNVTKTNPLKADTDGDGLTDSVEVNTTKTDPLKADTDGDGLTDGAEVNLNKTNPLSTDTDGDGLSDHQEVNVSKTNPLKADTDGDGISDSVEINTTKTDPLKADTDGDGISDSVEINTTKTDPLKADTDGDGVVDGVEIGSDPLKPLDTDVDGKINALDTDDDNDGIPTFMEDLNLDGDKNPATQPLNTDADSLPNYLDSDDDGDKKLTASEDKNLDNDKNPATTPTDTDGDGVPDYLDAVDTDGPTGDNDGDGLTNSVELSLGTNPDLSDSDADGIPDKLEVGSDPAKPVDTDADGKINALDSDDDNDGIPTVNEDLNLDGDKNPATQATDTDSDTKPNYLDSDDDNDGLLTSSENYNGGTALDDDTDKDSKPDYLDTDDDNDGILSANEGNDPNKNGLPEDAVDADQDGIDDYLDATVNIITLQMRAMLQGAFNSTSLLMRDDLRAKGLIPSKQPYTIAPYAYTGTEQVAANQLTITGNNAPVDWVLIELRAASDGKTVLHRKAALVQRDGDIVEADTGNTTLRISGALPGNYYVAIRHRNHLGVMSSAALSLMATPTLVDFTAPTTKTYGEVAGRIQNKGVSLLWAGDANMDARLISNGVGQDAGVIYAKILSAPLNTSFSSNFVVSGYNATDFTLDGDTIFTGPNNDTNILVANVLVYPTNTNFNANYIVKSQLP